MRLSVACASALLFAGQTPASDSLSLIGATGALTTPTAGLLSAGRAEAHANNNPLISTSRKYQEARTYALAIGLLPRVELTGQLAAADRGQRSGYNDLSANAKISIFQNDQFALAAGALDFAGGAQRSKAFYGVASYTYRQFSLTGGYGAGKAKRDAASLDGLFGGLIIKPIEYIELLADYDSDHYSVGTRLSYAFPSSTTIAATAKLYSDGPQQSAFGLGISRNLDFRKDAQGQTRKSSKAVGLFNSMGHGLSNVSLATDEVEHSTLRAENATYLQRQADSDHAACASADGSTKTLYYRQLRYGLPIASTGLRCAVDESGRTSWWTMLDDASEIRRDFLRAEAYRLEVRLAPDLRSFAGTEVGIFDYSAALLSSARLQLPAGLGGYVTYESPLNSTDDFSDPFLFDFYRHRKGLREAQVQWAHHFLPGLFGLHSYGKSRQFTIDYRSQRNDLVWNIGSGLHQLYGTQASYRPHNSFLPKRKLQYAGYRLWLGSLQTSLQADYGQFFYGDKGFRIKASRHFGDTIISLYLNRENAENQVAGLQLSLPLTPWKGLSAGPISVVGTPRFDFNRGTSFGQSDGGNDIKPLLMVEPTPTYQLRTDWLDVDRLFPAYPSGTR